jgi:hypothetical protein
MRSGIALRAIRQLQRRERTLQTASNHRSVAAGD